MARLNAITGGAGFLGLHLAAALLARGEEVVLVDLPEALRRQNPALSAIRSRCRVWEHDLMQPLGGEFSLLPIERVFLLAGVVGVQRVLSAPERALLLNQLATWNALDACRRAGCRWFCFASTSEVYDAGVRLGFARFPVAEDTPAVIDPSLPSRTGYALGKLGGEFLVATMARQVCGTAILARFHSIYGPNMGHKHVISEFIGRALAHRDPFPVFGRQVRHFCYVDDAISALLTLGDAPIGVAVMPVNIGNDGEATDTVDLARMIATLAGYEPTLDIRDAPEASPPVRKPSLERLRAAIGFEPTVRLADGLARTFDWYSGVGRLAADLEI